MCSLTFTYNWYASDRAQEKVMICDRGVELDCALSVRNNRNY